MLMKYEDLCADVSGTLGSVFDFVGVGRENVRAINGEAHHIIGNRMRLDRDSGVILREEWKQLLSPAEKKLFEVSGWWVNAIHGYGRE
jgi:hypothetical protein